MEFVDIDGAVLGFFPGEDQHMEKPVPVVPEEKARFENEINHQHFDFPLGNSVWEEWKNNLTLACTVMDYWKMKLSILFPEREFVMFIYNELALVCDQEPDEEPFAIVPALRMWSKQNDPDEEMFRSFCVDQARLDHIEVRENYRPTFFPESAVFTKDGSMRKAFLAKLQRTQSSWGGRVYL